MRKWFLLLSISLVFLAACGSRVERLEEFPYLPAYPNMLAEVNDEDLEDEDIDETEDIDEELVDKDQLKKATYTIKNANEDIVIKEYEEILNKDGWETTLISEPALLQVAKDEHRAMIVVYSKKDILKMDISSR